MTHYFEFENEDDYSDDDTDSDGQWTSTGSESSAIASDSDISFGANSTVFPVSLHNVTLALAFAICMIPAVHKWSEQ